MMIRTIFAAAIAVTSFAMAGCYSAPIMPPSGLLFSNVNAPVQASGDIGARKGEATCAAFLGIVAWGDCSLQAAAQAGGITTVKHSDYAYTNVIVGIYQSYTTVAYGD